MKKLDEIQRAYHQVPDLWEASRGAPGTTTPNGYVLGSSPDEASRLLPSELIREKIEKFPQLSEQEVVRHFTKLSQLNFGVDSGMYPLGSCTMKYNPKVNDWVASLEGLSSLHPAIPEKHAQGALEILYLLQETLIAITGMKGCTLTPAAGAHGELVGVKMISAYHRKKGNKSRNTIIIPDSAHGTNPASAALSGLKVKQLASNERGTVDLKTVDAAMDDSVAAIMITVPNTLGIFEDQIVEISKLIHDRGGLVYCDGANLNAMVGQVDVGAMGVDVMHINVHKTFSIPHGGGGPGAGPVVVSDRLIDFLPIPVVREKEGTYSLDSTIPHTIGRFRSNYGNFANLVRSLCYIYAFGREDLAKISEAAVLNANYLKAKLREYFHLPYDAPSLHEVVFNDKLQEKTNHVTTLDMAKRLMDFGIHPMTIYFPLVVRGAIMIEPTESESKADLDHFISAMIQIAKEAQEEPAKVKGAPHNLGIKRLDETRAAREPRLTWNQE